HQAQSPFVGYVRRRRENVDGIQQRGPAHDLLQCTTDLVLYLAVVEAALALLHLATQIRAYIEPPAPVAAVEVGQATFQPTQRIAIHMHRLLRLQTAQHHARGFQPARRGFGAARRAAEKNAARDAATRL